MKGIEGKLGTLGSLPMALGLLFLFFAPLLEVQCQEHALATANGWQISTGQLAQSDFLKEMNKDKPPAKTEDGPPARPWFFLALVLPLALLAVGGLGVARGLGPRPVGIALIALGVLGLGLMVAGANIDYATDMAKQAQAGQPKPPPAGAPNNPMAGPMNAQMEAMQKQMLAGIATKATASLWLSLVLYILIAVCGAMNLFLPVLLQGGARTAHLGPAAAPVAAAAAPPDPGWPRT